nr:MAG TPA: hypothetical protein [Caudoviricetes sp.]
MTRRTSRRPPLPLLTTSRLSPLTLLSPLGRPPRLPLTQLRKSRRRTPPLTRRLRPVLRRLRARLTRR